MEPPRKKESSVTNSKGFCPHDTKCNNPNCPYRHSTSMCQKYEECATFHCGARHAPTRRPLCSNPSQCCDVTCAAIHPLIRGRYDEKRKGEDDDPSTTTGEVLQPANRFRPTLGKIDALANFQHIPVICPRYLKGECGYGSVCRSLHLQRDTVPENITAPPNGYVWHQHGLLMLIHAEHTVGKLNAQQTGQGKLCENQSNCPKGTQCENLHVIPSADESMFHTFSDGAYRVLSDADEKRITCCVCSEATSRAIHCAKGHCMCDECLSRFITEKWGKEIFDLGNFPPVFCPMTIDNEKCTSPPFPPFSLARHLFPEAFSTYVEVCRRVLRFQGKSIPAQTTTEATTTGTEVDDVACQAANQTEIATTKEDDEYEDMIMLRDMFQGSAYMCPKCNFGPLDYAGCSDVMCHQGEALEIEDDERHTRSYGIVNNACPKCGFLPVDETEYLTWDGVFRSIDSSPALGSEESNSDLRELLDMGFSMHEARGALYQHANDLEAATAYILSTRDEMQRAASYSSDR